MICGNCNNSFKGKNFGVMVTEGRAAAVVDICSKDCRAEFRRTNEPAPTPIRKGGPVTNAGPRRKMSPAEIRKRNRPKETDISKSIANELDAAGVWNTRTQSGVIRTAAGHTINLCKPGTPDRVFNRGLNVWIEVKREGEPATPKQLETIAELKANGSLAFVLDNAADLKYVLSGLRDYAETIRDICRDVSIIQHAIDFELSEARRQR